MAGMRPGTWPCRRSGRGPGVLVIQEWWGLDPASRRSPIVSAPPGSWRSRRICITASSRRTTRWTRRRSLMRTLPPERAARDMSGAIDYLAGIHAVTSDGIGVVGFCMGGMLAFLIAAHRPDRVKAVVPFYGFPQGAAEPDWSKLTRRSAGTWPSTTTSSPRSRSRARSEAAGDGQRRHADGASGHRSRVHGPAQRPGDLNAALAARIWPEVISFLQSKLPTKAER